MELVGYVFGKWKIIHTISEKFYIIFLNMFAYNEWPGSLSTRNFFLGE